MKATTGEEITENTIPDLDDWGWDSFWTCSDWVEWHKVMKDKKGKQYADATFITWFNKQSTGAHVIDCRSLNTAFRDYMRSENLLDSLFSGVGVIAQPIGVGTDVVDAAGDIVSSTASGLSTTAKVLKYAIPIVIGIGVIILIVWAWKKWGK